MSEDLKSLAKSAGVELVPVGSGRWTCDRVDGGRPLAAVEMAGELRIMIGGAVGILARGWTDFKDTAKAHALPWQTCVELRNPEQLRGVSQLIVSKSAHMRYDWRAWFGILAGQTVLDLGLPNDDLIFNGSKIDE